MEEDETSVQPASISKRGSNDFSAVFVTEIVMVMGDVALVPCSSDFENDIESIVGGFIDTVTGNVRLLNHEDLEQYTELYDVETEATDASAFSDIITNDVEFQQLFLELKRAIRDTYQSCEIYLEMFVPFRVMIRENQCFDDFDVRQKAEAGNIFFPFEQCRFRCDGDLRLSGFNSAMPHG